jgi:hypothetical protein
MATFGVDVNPTRIGEYRRVFAEIEKNYREGTIDELLARYGFALLANVLFESTELIQTTLSQRQRNFGTRHATTEP